MPYLKISLEHTLSVFQKLKYGEHVSLPSSEQRHLRNDYNFRQISSTQTVKHVSLFREDDSSSDDVDEYSPCLAKRKRKSLRVTPPERLPKRSKREAHASPGEPQPDDTSDGLETGRSSSAPPEDDETNKHEKADKPGPGRFYLDKLDEEAAKIDNEHGRRLRNQKFISDRDRSRSITTKKCLACTTSKSRCQGKRDNEKCCLRCRKNSIACVDAGEVLKQTPPPAPQESDDEVIKETIEWPPISQARAPASLVPMGLLPLADVPNSLTLEKAPTSVQVSSSLFSPQPPSTFQGSSSLRPQRASTPSQTIRSYAASARPQSPPINGQSSSISHGSAAGDSWENAIPLDLDSSPSPEASPHLSRPTVPTPSSSDGMLLTIRTTWAHPIEFKHIPSQSEPCHFCSDFRYGIYGYGEMEIDVIKYRNSADYEELGNGHRSCQREQTRMCIKCSLSRLYISRCAVHSIVACGVRSKAVEEWYLSQLLADDWVPECPSLKNGALQACSLCPNAAYWRCGADKCRDKVGRPIIEPRGRGIGCGLLLCDSCAPQVQVEGTLKRASMESSNMHEAKVGPRADVDFLFPGSLLHMAFRQ